MITSGHGYRRGVSKSSTPAKDINKTGLEHFLGQHKAGLDQFIVLNCIYVYNYPWGLISQNFLQLRLVLEKSINCRFHIKGVVLKL
jgi:hypothetical protein